MHAQYQICTRCIIDTTDPNIQFDENGICNHCRSYEEQAAKRQQTERARKEYLEGLVQEIKRHGQHKEYDCLIGVSGGVDSTYVAYYAVKHLGLRPLAVHLDNGWDAELAVSNIEKTLVNLNIPLYTKVLDWEVFKDIQVAFLRASVTNAEIPTDHAIRATLLQIAAEKNLPYILHGSNFVTESILPKSWGGYSNHDWTHIKAIHKRFGTGSLKDYPHYGFFKYWVYYPIFKKIREIPILNYISYSKKQAIETLEKEFGWRAYGKKHYESVYTRFFQGYILPRKFNYDKRKAHLSTLIMSGEMTREDALKEIERGPYEGYNLEEEKAYVSKKLGLTEAEFEHIMALPPKSHDEYPTSTLEHLMNNIAKIPLWKTSFGKFLIKALRVPRTA